MTLLHSVTGINFRKDILIGRNICSETDSLNNIGKDAKNWLQSVSAQFMQIVKYIILFIIGLIVHVLVEEASYNLLY